jgi:hypothetical protein
MVAETFGDHRLARQLGMKLLQWFAGEEIRPRVGRWHWNRDAWAVAIEKEEIYWVSGQRLEEAVEQSKWSDIEEDVRRAFRQWARAEEWPWTYSDEETGHLFGIAFRATDVWEEPEHLGERMFSIMNLTTGEGPFEVWGTSWIGAKPTAYHLQPLVDKAKSRAWTALVAEERSQEPS